MAACYPITQSGHVTTSMPEQHGSNRELVGQGIGNILSGLLGGLLLVVVLWAAPLLADIPMAILSAVAMKVGIDILDWSFLKRAHRVSKTSTLLMYKQPARSAVKA